MKEHTVERYFCDEVRRRGGMALKVTGYVGIPDRIAIMPGGVTLYAELKRPKGGRLSPAQRRYFEKLTLMGHRAYILRNKEEIDAVLAEWTVIRSDADHCGGCDDGAGAAGG